ncbi:phosphoribosylformylglycinamidine synthase subunit PurQ [Candidatus Daviesbacteria bacterium]|nr:phosphoribosylformylglycinamidine synthase subunit PurQ [Candidatus Daviesbacteria bacterium]
MQEIKTGIIRFPGSNCDFDTLKYFQKDPVFGPEFIWYKDRVFKKYDLYVLPGGFAFGDRYYVEATGEYEHNPGKMAKSAPVMETIHRAAMLGLPILGICNGFQILAHAGLLPGSLEKNASGKFYCDFTNCRVEGRSFFGDRTLLGRSFNIPVAHGYGRYVVDDKKYQEMEKNSQVFLKYLGFNPNGSSHDIAGVCNKEGNIFGMMPHPERSPDGQLFLEAFKKYILQL